MYIENQASRHSPPIAPHYPSAYCGLGRTIRQPIAVWQKFYEERGGDPPRQRSRDTSLIGREMHALGLLLPNATT